MIVEERIYTFHPGRLPQFLELYEREGLAVQLEHLPHMLGYYTTDVGVLSQLTTVWGYASADERAARRDALAADPRWLEFVGQVRPMMAGQQSRLLKPAPFFKSRLASMMTPVAN